MIIKSIAIENFQCYAGSFDQNIFEFRKGLNVVIGDNGSGKSKLYDAFFWVLYDKIFDSTTRSLVSTSDVGINLVADMAKAACAVGEQITTKVQLTLQDYKQNSAYPDEYILERKFAIQKTKDSEDYNDIECWKIPIASTRTIEKKDILNFKLMPGIDAFDRIANKLLPNDMKPYLWFQGEQVDSLIDFKNEKSLTEAINILSDINHYDFIIEVATKVYKQADAAYKSEISTKSKNEEVSVILSKRQDDLEKKINKDVEDLAAVDKNLAFAEEHKDDLLSKIKDAQDLEQIKYELKSVADKTRHATEKLEATKKGFNNNLFSKQWILRNAAPYFDAFEQKYKDFEEKREDLKIEHKIKLQQEEARKSRLPENVPNASYLKDMLNEKHCFLCDRDFEEGDKAHQFLTEIYDRTKNTRVYYSDFLQNDFKKFFQGLYNSGYHLKTHTISNVDSSIKCEIERIDKLEGFRTEAIQEYETLNAKLKHILGTSSISDEESKDIVRAFRMYDADKDKFKTQQSEINLRISSNKKELQEVEDKLKKFIGESLDKEIIEKKEVLEAFYELAKSTRAQVYAEQIKIIEEEANKHFCRMSAENRSVQGKIILKKHGNSYMPKNVDDNGIELTSINDSNIILIKLSTIMAIVTAKGKSEFHPLISDAPTSKFSDNYTIGFCDTVSDVFAQSIIISYDFYHNLALRQRLLKEVTNLGAIYIIEPSSVEKDRMNRKELFTKITALN
jgi:DNA sulfur modification protein DndD